ncbi:DUF418 domain-containing protein [Spirosoma sp. BT702]|uniref:DUF418 domain-containing protein n=1 Tax=Spirosoma profusum TaxID=2771354 RepID=A0A926Y2B6_9BACT|nr:DUF418 domain-containing protein [Spirosoma profusum]MBD2700656.1 DUF418 domain-containing protein [Spirosoma profusum]
MESTPTIDLTSNQPPLQYKPVAQAERIKTIDMLRGIALLGILLMNIPYFAMPERFSDAFRNDTGNINYWFSFFITIVFEGKMRALFSMIFGAGVLIFTERKEQAGAGRWAVTGLYYRRMGWLILFGLIHAHVTLWLGDILYGYGVCALILFWFRKLNPKWLLGIALVLGSFDAISNQLFYSNMREQRLAYLDVIKAEKAKQPLTKAQQEAKTVWLETARDFIPDKAEVDKNTKLMRGSYTDVASYVRPLAFKFQTKYMFFTLWDALGLMILGMALFKWGFLTGKLPRRTYWRCLAVGYGLGLPVVLFSWWYGHLYPDVTAFLDSQSVNAGAFLYPVQRMLLVVAHVSALILLIQSGVAQGVFRALSAVGQMAFTNYILHTILCTLIFFGYGLGYFGYLEYYQLYGVVLLVWTVNIVFSTMWLRSFQFGPLEWVWRSLTYWQRQPIRRS